MKIKPLAKKKRDYRLFCKLFYTASPSEHFMGFVRAGCNIAPRGIPCKNCRRCKHGIQTPWTVDEVHEIDGGIVIKAIQKGAGKK